HPYEQPIPQKPADYPDCWRPLEADTQTSTTRHLSHGDYLKFSPTDREEKPVSLEKIRLWASKPGQNVHRIIGIVVRRGPLPRELLVQEIQRLHISLNPYGAVASLMTNAGNAYGRVFIEQAGLLSIHPKIENAIRQQNWRHD